MTAEKEGETGGEEIEAGAGRGTEEDAAAVEIETAGREGIAGATAGTGPESSSTEIAAEAETTLLKDGAGVEAEAGPRTQSERKGGVEAKAGIRTEANREAAAKRMLKKTKPEQNLTGLKGWILQLSETVRNEKIVVEVGVLKRLSFLSLNLRSEAAEVGVPKQQSSPLPKTRETAVVSSKKYLQPLIQNSFLPLWERAWLKTLKKIKSRVQ